MKNYKRLLVTGCSFLTALFYLIITSGCQHTPENSRYSEKQHSITVTGAFALYPMMEVWATKYQEANPAVKIFLFPASSTKGNLAVINDQADIGMFSKSPETIQNRPRLKVYAVAQDAVVVTINSKNPWKEVLLKKGIKQGDLKEIFLQNNTQTWSLITGVTPGNAILSFTRSDLCGAGQMFSEFLGTLQENLSGIGVYGDPGMVQAIENQVYSIGYDNLRYVYNNVTGGFYEGIVALPIDFNENNEIDPEEDFYHSLSQLTTAMKSGSYPPPLTKDLYLLLPDLTPDSIAVNFVNWILQDGQQFVEKAGYVKIENAQELINTFNQDEK